MYFMILGLIIATIGVFGSFYILTSGHKNLKKVK